jgi:hypothetical protein
MARPRTPTAQLEARGAFLKHPERERVGSEVLEAQPGLEFPRKGLAKNLVPIWLEIKGYLAPGVLKQSDGPAFETLVRLVAIERGMRKIGKVKFPLTDPERGQMIKLFSLFGMTPSDRSKVHVDAPKESAIAKFLRRSKPTNTKPC